MKAKTQIKTITSLALILYAIIWYAKNFSQQVDLYYSKEIYPILHQVRAAIFDLLPFPFGDLAYGFVFFYLFYLLKKTKWNNWTIVILKLVKSGLIVLILFQLSWGLNYYRSPLLNEIDTQNYTEDELIYMTRFFAQKSNRLHFQLSENDTLELNFQAVKKTSSIAYKIL